MKYEASARVKPTAAEQTTMLHHPRIKFPSIRPEPFSMGPIFSSWPEGRQAKIMEPMAMEQNNRNYSESTQKWLTKQNINKIPCEFVIP